MEPITDVRDISRIAYGFMASRALFAALDLGIFDHLAGEPRKVDAVSRDTGIAPNRLLVLLSALLSVGLVVRDGDGYRNAPASQDFLVRGRPKFYGDYLRVVNGQLAYPYLMELDRGLRGEQRARSFYEVYYSDPKQAAAFTRAQHSGSLGPATLLARRIDLSERRRLLDVGGGSGAFTITLCQRWPQLTATIVDFPQTVDVARQCAAAAGLADRIRHLPGNALEVDWPPQQDVILMSYLWSAIGRGDIETLIARTAGTLVPGGLLLVHDFMVKVDLSGPPIAAWHLLASVLDNPEISCLTTDLVGRSLAAGGFQLISGDDLVPGITSLVVARKPA